MPVRETAAICIISTTAGAVTFCILRKILLLPTSHIRRDAEDAGTVYINLMALSQPYRSTQAAVSEACLFSLPRNRHDAVDSCVESLGF